MNHLITPIRSLKWTNKKSKRHYLFYALVYNGGNNHLNIWGVWSTRSFSPMLSIAERTYFHFQGRFNNSFPYYKTDGETSSPTTLSCRYICKSHLLQNGQPYILRKGWGLEWCLAASRSSQSFICHFYRAFGKFSEMKGVIILRHLTTNIEQINTKCCCRS